VRLYPLHYRNPLLERRLESCILAGEVPVFGVYIREIEEEEGPSTLPRVEKIEWTVYWMRGLIQGIVDFSSDGS
jgi:hypothetical protein